MLWETLKPCRERLVGVKEHLGLSQEALVEEHETTLQLQLQARWLTKLHTPMLDSELYCIMLGQA